MAESGRVLPSPASSSRSASVSSSFTARPRLASTASLALATERLTLVNPADLTPAEAADLKDEEADRLLAQGDLDGALHALQKAIYLRPDHAPLYAKLARVYWDLCDLKSAMASFRKLLAIDANPPQRVKDQFAMLLDLHAYSQLLLGESPAVAIAYLTEAIQLNSLEETFWLHRALAHIHAQSLDKALKDVDHCVNLNGKDVEYVVLRAKLHWKLHMHEKATQDIQRAARLMPHHPEVVEHELRLRNESQTIYAQACRHLMVRKFGDAIKCLTNAAEISPHETKIYLLRAAAHRELGDLQTAMKDIDMAMGCHNAKRETLAREKQTVSATAVPRRRVLQNDGTTEPASPPPPNEAQTDEDRTREYRDIATQRNLILNDLALQFLRAKSFQVALNAMNQVVQSEAEIAARFREPFINPQFYVNRGDAYRGLGNLHAALADYHHALEGGPQSQDVRSRVALIHYQFGIDFFNQAQFPKAELEFAKAIAEDASVATYHVRKGDAARFQEKHHVACEDYLNAMRLNPHNLDTSNKLLQYAIDPKTKLAAEKAQARRVGPLGRNDLVDCDHEKPQLNNNPSPAKSAASAVSEALQSYKRKNRTVQDLFLHRPTLPPAKSKRNANAPE